MSTRILVGDCRKTLASLPDQSVNCCVTSPPYFGLRDYGHGDQIGLEQTPDAFVTELVAVFREVRRVLRDDGTLWLNLGDSYARGFGGGSPGEKSATNVGAYKDREVGKIPEGLKGKDLVGIPWMVAFALRADGWYLRSDIIWAKPNPMPESVTDRPTKSHEYLFLLTKSERYCYDNEAVQEDALTGWNGSSFTDERDLAVRPTTGRQPRFGGEKYGDSDDQMHQTKSGNEYAPTGKRNKRTVWTVPTSPYKGAHFATFPPALIEPCILAGCPKDGTVLDPFGGAGTTGLVADRLGRNAILCELNPTYAQMAADRLTSDNPMFTTVEVVP